MGGFATPRRAASPRVAGEFAAWDRTLLGRFKLCLVPLRKRSMRCIVRLFSGTFNVKLDITGFLALTSGATLGGLTGSKTLGDGVATTTGSMTPGAGFTGSRGVTHGAGLSGVTGSGGGEVGRVTDDELSLDSFHTCTFSFLLLPSKPPFCLLVATLMGST